MPTNTNLEENSSEHTVCSNNYATGDFHEDCRNFNNFMCPPFLQERSDVCRRSFIKGAKNLLVNLQGHTKLDGYDNGLENIDLTNNFEKKRDNLLSLDRDKLKNLISLDKDDVNKILMLDKDDVNKILMLNKEHITRYLNSTKEQREVILKSHEKGSLQGGRRRRKGTKKRKKKSD